MRDGAILDPARPEALVYAGASGESRLLAAMYVMPRAGIAGPCIGSSLTQWHAHTNLCFDRSTRAVVGSVGPRRSCPPGAVNRVTPEMLHVWVVPNPGGPFASVTDPPARSRR